LERKGQVSRQDQAGGGLLGRDPESRPLFKTYRWVISNVKPGEVDLSFRRGEHVGWDENEMNKEWEETKKKSYLLKSDGYWDGLVCTV